MSTKIENSKTGEIVEISVIDPKTGIDWSADLIGNANDVMLTPCDDDCDYIGDPETVEWWVDYCARYEAADHELYEALRIHEDTHDDGYYTARGYVNDHINGVEFGDLPTEMADLARRIRENDF